MRQLPFFRYKPCVKWSIEDKGEWICNTYGTVFDDLSVYSIWTLGFIWIEGFKKIPNIFMRYWKVFQVIVFEFYWDIYNLEDCWGVNITYGKFFRKLRNLRNGFCTFRTLLAFFCYFWHSYLLPFPFCLYFGLFWSSFFIYLLLLCSHFFYIFVFCFFLLSLF